MKPLSLFVFISILFTSFTQADEYRPAYLEFEQISDNAFKMLWKVPAKGKNQRLSLYVHLPNDVVQSSDPISTFVGSAYIERSTISRQGGLAGVKVSVYGLQQLATDVLVRIQRLDGSSETARLNASATSFVVKGAAQFWDVVHTYFVFGVEHILGGFDHLLFVACLIFIAGTWQRILVTITGFTVAHSITLVLAAIDLVHLPAAPIEAAIALSIVFLAREIVLDRRDTLTWRYPVAVAASFGLLHGFGFASALSEIGLPQAEIPAALLMFNIGVELGQIAFVAGMIFVFWLITQCLKIIKKGSLYWLSSVEKSLAYCVGTITMFWTIERIAGFWL